MKGGLRRRPVINGVGFSYVSMTGAGIVEERLVLTRNLFVTGQMVLVALNLHDVSKEPDYLRVTMRRTEGSKHTLVRIRSSPSFVGTLVYVGSGSFGIALNLSQRKWTVRGGRKGVLTTRREGRARP